MLTVSESHINHHRATEKSIVAAAASVELRKKKEFRFWVDFGSPSSLVYINLRSQSQSGRPEGFIFTVILFNCNLRLLCFCGDEGTSTRIT